VNAQVKALLKPEILNTINGLELIARIVVEGFMSGSNKSQSLGIGQEFSQYRSYEPGDDLRLLDWKMYARSERYYIKLAEIETNITVKFILDASNSMSYEEGGISKLQYAKIMMAALAYLARKQSDTYGFYGINDKAISIIHPRFEQQQFMRFLNTLVKLKSEGNWHTGKKMESLLEHHGKEMIVFITDLYDHDSDIIKFISNLKTTRNEIIVFHVLGKHEHAMDWEGSFTFEDLETGNRVKVDTTAQQQVYHNRISAWVNESRNQLLEKHISYHLVTMDTPVEEVLQNFLKTRKSLIR
jgi:uncharacterized protein (DUF58 family)